MFLILAIYYLWFWTFLRHVLLKEVTMSNCYLKFLMSSLRRICRISSVDMFIEQSISCSLLRVASSLRHRYCLLWGVCGEAEATGGACQKWVSPRHRWTRSPWWQVFNRTDLWHLFSLYELKLIKLTGNTWEYILSDRISYRKTPTHLQHFVTKRSPKPLAQSYWKTCSRECSCLDYPLVTRNRDSECCQRKKLHEQPYSTAL